MIEERGTVEMSGGRVRASVRAWRRTAVVGALVGTAVLVTAAVAPGTSAAQSPPGGAFDNGTGGANATALRVNPVNGGLSFGVTVGESLSGHQNTVASAESRAASLGVIGTTLAGEGCDGGDPTLPAEQQPQPLYIDSTIAGSSEGLSTPDQILPVVARNVRATLDPYAESTTTLPGLNIPGILSIGTITSHTSSGVFGDYREAKAVVTIGSISLLGGLITVDGLRWEAVHRSGSIEEQTGAFSVLAAKGPLNIPLPVEGVFNLIEGLNGILRPLGLEIRLPKFHVDTTAAGTLSTVDPLVVAVIPAPLRDDNITGPLLSALQPIRQALTNALIEADCGNATYVTILDVALATITRGGSLGIELGGVQASTAAITRAPSSPTTTRPPSTTPTTSRPATTSGSSNCCATGTTSRSTATTAATTATTVASDTGSDDGTDIDDAIDAADIKGERGGPLLAVGAGGILLLLATAEGDRRKMRRAQREIPTEG